MLIRTERLRLRCLEEKDRDITLHALNDWEVAQWLVQPPYPYRAADFEAYLALVRADHAGGRPLRFAVARAEDDAMIGCIGIDLGEDGAEGELGYWYGRDHWGEGRATEAARALVAYAHGRAAIPRLVAVTDPENERSHRVLLKAGFSLLGLRPASAVSKRGTRFVRAYERAG